MRPQGWVDWAGRAAEVRVGRVASRGNTCSVLPRDATSPLRIPLLFIDFIHGPNEVTCYASEGHAIVGLKDATFLQSNTLASREPKTGIKTPPFSHFFNNNKTMTNRPTATLDSSLVEGSLNGFFLTGLEWLDQNYGAADWSARHVAVVSAIFLGFTRLALKSKGGVDWYSFLHAAATGYLSFVCVWLNVFGAETLTGSPEPLRSIQCQGPLTSLHRIVPAITMGYGVFDIIEGFSHGVDFLMHGFATFTVMAYFCEYDVGEIIVPMLLMEISTVHLCFMKTPILSETALAVNMAFFTLTFFLFRILICPYLWWGIFSNTWQHKDDPTSQVCLPWHFKYVVFVFGMFFNILNTYWAYKIILKVMRKLSGKEKVKERNDLKKDT